jgi:CRISPR-associated protein Cas1
MNWSIPCPVLLSKRSNFANPAASNSMRLIVNGASISVTHSYRRALELQARLLAKRLTGEIAEYIPLLTR